MAHLWPSDCGLDWQFGAGRVPTSKNWKRSDGHAFTYNASTSQVDHVVSVSTHLVPSLSNASASKGGYQKSHLTAAEGAGRSTGGGAAAVRGGCCTPGSPRRTWRPRAAPHSPRPRNSTSGSADVKYRGDLISLCTCQFSPCQVWSGMIFSPFGFKTHLQLHPPSVIFLFF